jgi:hypothetical protein
MNLEVRTVMHQSEQALTVDQVTQEIAERIRNEIRSILNALVEKKELHCIHGDGGYKSTYKAAPIKRR